MPPKALKKTSVEVQASQEVHKVTAHVVKQSSSATSSIVPVIISTVEEPKREVLTYALLDTQSDSTFILEDLLDDLNADTQPVQLRLSTMSAVDPITASKRVRGLQVRGLQTANSLLDYSNHIPETSFLLISPISQTRGQHCSGLISNWPINCHLFRTVRSDC